ncbi:RNA 2',3'-cyclic phosphodiesterase [Primorskyibacter sp. S87]|uniref:RNA 2',3'-cyclic phosphodiesterase n=1 Tax=Primorskyibacter sp. S87 TaxID=3415126 RepID=UPI003C7D9AC9
MRSFIAINPGEDTGRALCALQSRLPAGRPVPGHNLHLTLAFLDDQPEERLEELHYELEQIEASCFEVQPAGLGWFGRSTPNLIYADLEPSPALQDLHARVVRAVHVVGIQTKLSRFRPHITLARMRQHPNASEVRDILEFFETGPEFRAPPFLVERFGLYQSTLMPTGAVHDELASYELNRLAYG